MTWLTRFVFPFRPGRTFQRLFALLVTAALVYAAMNYGTLLRQLEAGGTAGSASCGTASCSATNTPGEGADGPCGGIEADAGNQAPSGSSLTLAAFPAPSTTKDSVPTQFCLEVQSGADEAVSFSISEPDGGEDIPSITTDADGVALASFDTTSRAEVTATAGASEAELLVDPLAWADGATPMPVSTGASGSASQWSALTSFESEASAVQLTCFEHQEMDMTATQTCSSSPAGPNGWGPAPAPSTAQLSCAVADAVSAAIGIASCAVTATLVGCAAPETGIGAAACIFGLSNATWAAPQCISSIVSAVMNFLTNSNFGDVQGELTGIETAQSNTDLVQNGVQAAATVVCGTVEFQYGISPQTIPMPSGSSSTDETVTVTDKNGDPEPGAVVYLTFSGGAGGSAAVGSVPLSTNPVAAVTNSSGEVVITYTYPATVSTTSPDVISVAATQGGATVASATYQTTFVTPGPCGPYEPPSETIISCPTT